MYQTIKFQSALTASMWLKNQGCSSLMEEQIFSKICNFKKVNGYYEYNPSMLKN